MKSNESRISEFILLGFTDVRKLQLLFFAILLFAYLLTITGNFVIIILTNLDHRLQTPMYFFLWNFSIVEIGFTTTVTPQTLSHLLTGHKNILYVGCVIQSYMYFHLGTTEFFLLAVMSYDRYLAICNPLRYPSIMHKSLCTLLVSCCWIGSFLIIIGSFVILLQLPMCDSNILDHFFCDYTPLFQLLCGDKRFLELFGFITAALSLLGTLTVSVASYINIVRTVLNIPSATGRKKAFSTCASHFVVVSITYGSCIFLYISPSQAGRVEFGKIVAILNTIVSPLLNPFIYSLRNQQVQEALKDLLRQVVVFIIRSKENLNTQLNF
ncbi:olfactory receptor 6C1-like [Ahaetulla prasina]|uniref:olfactory receptor 6C1-like n=1 Tax=Ahaetulla prasina TaxID=499056 RepID=UPI00264A4049|nr:olfactory receptor 6C1-like [Ahaetulla prasina]